MPTVYQPGQAVDHYTIIEVLGRGGASHVYLARDQHTQQEVVLKFPHIDEIGSADVFACYQREREIGRRLSHPRLQRHLNQTEQRSGDYLVLEYLHGQTLRVTMKQCAPDLLPAEEVIRLLLQLADILAFVHEHGVIHRDIKPENILRLENGEIVVCDFGLAQWARTSKRHLGGIGIASPIGTPDYMAPELLWGKPGSVQSDCYAVGVMLYELLCGHTPFKKLDGFEFVTEHISHDPPGILTAQPTLSPVLATVVMRAIRRDPRKRYASMRELWHDLAHLEDVTPTDYLPDPPLVGGRYRQVLRLALIVLVFCVVIVAFGLLAQFAHPAAR